MVTEGLVKKVALSKDSEEVREFIVMSTGTAFQAEGVASSKALCWGACTSVLEEEQGDPCARSGGRERKVAAVFGEERGRPDHGEPAWPLQGLVGCESQRSLSRGGTELTSTSAMLCLYAALRMEGRWARVSHGGGDKWSVSGCFFESGAHRTS